jgi:Fe-S cluster assembly ATP-binding protein
MTNNKQIVLRAQNLDVAVGGTQILKNLNLTVRAGEVHAVLGPNGSGKSTFVQLLAGNPELKVTNGSISIFGQEASTLTPEARARLGLFVSFQYPVEVPGVSNGYFLREAVNACRKARGQALLSATDFLKRAKLILEQLKLPANFLERSLNDQLSGGEKKRNEMLQLMLLEPRLAVLDELDSGLDVDALRVIGSTLQGMRTPQRSFIIVTHYPTLLTQIKPDVVHVLQGGTIIKTGTADLVMQVAEKGFEKS